MKQKEIIQVLAAILIFAVAGFLIYNQMTPKKKTAGAKKGHQVEKITQIPANYDQQAMSLITDTTKIHDYYTAPDLKSGLGNTQPFGPLH